MSAPRDALWRFAYRCGFRLRLLHWRLARPRLEGSYVAVWHAGRVLAIRNSYRRRLSLPAGGLARGEKPLDAALRELREEVGLALEPDAVLGLLDDYPTRSGYVITPVVVWGGDDAKLAPDPREVAAIHRIELAALLRPEVPRLRRIPQSDRPVISIPLQVADVHAPTAAIVYQLREVVLRGESTRVAHFEQPVFAWR
jgi:8-oxo-dGTP pyrophosphatase MutT (NUDIX family)